MEYQALQFDITVPAEELLCECRGVYISEMLQPASPFRNLPWQRFPRYLSIVGCRTDIPLQSSNFVVAPLSGSGFCI